MILCCRPFHARGGAVTGLVRRAGSAAGPRARAVPVPRARMTQGETKDPCRSRRADPGSARPGFSPARARAARDSAAEDSSRDLRACKARASVVAEMCALHRQPGVVRRERERERVRVSDRQIVCERVRE